jgi:putative PIN family toxin of toxin-antitoxin system
MVFLQNAARPGRTHATFHAVTDGKVTLCLSVELVSEVRSVLNRQNIRSHFPALTKPVVEIFIADLLTLGTLFDPIPQVFTWPAHPDDDHLFNLSIAAKADRLVTWEQRLLKLIENHPQDAERLQTLAPQLRIVTPINFSAELAAMR